MEWIVTEARTVADAKEVALDQLGVDEREAEFEVLVEPQRGLLGLGRANAQVRARVMPRVETPPDRRSRQRRARGGGRQQKSSDSRNESRKDSPARGREAAPRAKEKKVERRPAAGASGGRATKQAATSRSKGRGEKMNTVDSNGGEERMDPTNEEELVRSFTGDLTEAFGIDATVTTSRTEEGALQVTVDGAEVGLLIGRRGTTLAAIEELLRVVVQRRAQGRRSSKVRLEVGGYRQRRKEALEAFAQRIAEEVVETGEPKILEPMNAADRKIVHDAIVEITGVETASEGEEPRRRVVMRPGA